ncbi:hypothetical protein DS2_12488 [Catenovulum agarivorans DS-2]|uniref:Uncharacterized protein n=1 Tax=Catenovulum agarivorans DS-2 TaxID=1328313 RepID=W7QW41_9ALTE|nr:hypothetical protein [Catenovulum agarivorans]EWH09500.1 hypothetical protein DS2_12488 [Catenovulum agarivorans DS-2]
MTNIALIGCGTYLDLYFDMHPEVELNQVKVILDNAPNISEYQKIPVRKLKDMTEKDMENYDFFTITSRHHIDLHNQLLTMGITQNKIKVFTAIVSL